VNDRPRDVEPSARPDVAEGEILVDSGGNVTVGVPTAIAIVEYPHDGDPED